MMDELHEAVYGILACIAAAFAILLYVNPNFRIAIINFASTTFFFAAKALIVVTLTAIVFVTIYKCGSYFAGLTTRHFLRVDNLAQNVLAQEDELKKHLEEFEALDRNVQSRHKNLSEHLQGIEARLKKLEPISLEIQQKMDQVEKQFVGEKA